MADWMPIETAPKDGTAILFAGKWRPFDANPGGTWHIAIARWSTFMSNHTGYQWILEPLNTLDNINVEFTHWMPLPPPPTEDR
jgi:hypothetical protein